MLYKEAPNFVFKDNSTQNIKYLDRAHGFFSNSISGIQQDGEGRIWVASATDGLCRYDGRQMAIYSVASGLPTDAIENLWHDPEGKLWISTNDGVCYLRDNQLVNLICPEMPLKQITFIAPGTGGERWIGTNNNGVYRLTGDSIEHFDINTGLKGNSVRCMLKDSNGNYWFGTNRGVIQFNGEGFTCYAFSGNPLQNPTCVSIHENREGLWLGLYSRPLVRYKHGVFTEFRFGGRENQHVFGFATNRRGTWIADYGFGVIQLTEDKIQNITPSMGLSSASAYRIFSDDKNNIWVAGLFGGISRIEPDVFIANNPEKEIPLNITEGIVHDPVGRVWFLPNGGELSREDSDAFIQFTNDGNRIIPPMHHAFGGICPGDGSILLGTYSTGLCRVDERYFRYTLFDTGNYLMDLVYGNGDDLWCATMNAGLIQRKGGVYYHIGTKQGLASDELSNLFIDSRKRLFVAVGSKGLDIIYEEKIAHLTEESGLSSNSITCFWEDSLHRVWIGGDNGIDIFTGSGLIKLNRDNGLGQGKIKSLVGDEEGNIWIAQENGITRLRFMTDSTISSMFFDNSYGLRVSDFNSSVLSLPGRTLLWGTNQGILRLNPALDLEQNSALDLLFYRSGKDEIPIQQSMSGKVTIGPGEQLQLGFVGIDWGNESTIRYKYALLGKKDKDTVWVQLGTQNWILIKDIVPGDYRLIVSAVSRTGNPATLGLTLTVLPHFWESVWFRTLLILVFVILGPLIFFLYTVKARRTRMKLERIVDAKTAELIQENKVKDLLVQEIHHRVKNNLQTISSLIDMQVRSMKDPLVRQSLTDTQVRIQALAIVHEMLYAEKNKNPEHVSVKDYLSELVASINEMSNTHHLPVIFDIEAAEVTLNANDCIAVGILTSEVISNAIKHAFKDQKEPRITIRLEKNEEMLRYSIHDNGKGMDSSLITAERSLGLRLIRIFAQQLKAGLDIKNEAGTVVSLVIPASKIK